MGHYHGSQLDLFSETAKKAEKEALKPKQKTKPKPTETEKKKNRRVISNQN
jgi:hypothetical protein